MASIVVKVAGTVRTSYVCQPDAAPALEWGEALRERKTLSLSFISLDGTWVPLRGQHITFEFVSTTIIAGTPESLLFGGYITEVDKRKVPGRATIIAACSCVSYEQILDRRRAASYVYTNAIAGGIFNQVATDSLGGEGFTTETETGPVIPAFTIQEPRPSVAQVYDKLCELASNLTDVYYWDTSAAKKLRFFKQDTYPAPFSITSANPYVLGEPGEYASVSESNQGIVNRVWVYVGQYVREATTQTFTGDGAARIFELDYPASAAPTISVDGVEVGDFLGVEGETGKQWYWTLNSPRIRQDDAGTLLTSSNHVAVTYQGLDRRAVGPFDQAASASAEGVLQGDGTGVYESYLEIDAPLGAADVETTAQAFLDRYHKATITFHGATFTPGLRAGQELTVNLTDLGINLSMLIQSVRITDHGAGLFLWSFTAIAGAARDDWKRALLGQNDTGSVSGTGPGAGTPGGEPEAPNVTATLSALTFAMASHNSKPVFSGTITLPVANPDYAEHFEQVIIYAVAPTTGAAYEIARYYASEITGSTHAYSGSTDDVIQGSAAKPGYLLRFIAYNKEGVPSADPYEIGSITIPALAITAVVGADVTGSRWVDANRSAHVVSTATISCATYPTLITLWINLYRPKPFHAIAQRKWQGWFQIDGAASVISIGSPNSNTELFAPFTDETWSYTAALGAVDSDEAPVGAFTGSTFTVVKAGLPSATNVTGLSFAAGVGGDWPYNKITQPDLVQYWSIPSFQYDDTAAFSDVNTFTIVTTFQDYGAAGTPIGIEHPFGTPDVKDNGGVQVFGPVDGPYGNVADPPRSGNIAFIRCRIYCCNRVDQTTSAWSNALASTLQTNVGGVGVNHVDVTVAAGGVNPSSALAAGDTDGPAPNLDVSWITSLGVWHTMLHKTQTGSDHTRYGYQGVITPPALTDTTFLRQIHISRIALDGGRLPLLTLAGPFPAGVARSFKTDALDDDYTGAQIEFACENGQSIITAGPYTVLATGVAAPTGVAVEFSILASEETTLRHITEMRGLVVTLNAIPVMINPVYPATVTFWTTRPARTGESGPVVEWRGWNILEAAGGIYLGAPNQPDQFDYWAPAARDEQWTVSFALGKYYAGEGIPANAKTSAPFTVAAPAVPLPTAASDAYIDQVTFGAADKSGLFGWLNMWVTLPLNTPEFQTARWSVQNGAIIDGVFIPGGQHGGLESTMGDLDDRTVFVIPGTTRVTRTNDNLWDIPGYKLENGNLNPYNVFRIRIYVQSRNDANGTGGAFTLQNCWSAAVGTLTPGTADHQDIVLDLNAHRGLGSNLAATSSSNAHLIPGQAVPLAGDGSMTLDPFNAVSVNQFVLNILNMAGSIPTSRVSNLSAFDVFGFANQTNIQKVSTLPSVDLYGLSGGTDVQRRSGLNAINVLTAFANSSDVQPRSTLGQVPLTSFLGGLPNSRISDLSAFNAFNFSGATDIQRQSTIGLLNVFNFSGATDIQRQSTIGQVNVFNFQGAADIQKVSTIGQVNVFNFSGATDIQRVSVLGNVQINVFGGVLNANFQISDGSISGNKIQSLQVSKLSGWDGASIQVNSTLSFNGGGGIQVTGGGGIVVSPGGVDSTFGYKVFFTTVIDASRNAYFANITLGGTFQTSSGEAGLSTGSLDLGGGKFLRFQNGALVAKTGL